jgi:Uri superfamily endonuclease
MPIDSGSYAYTGTDVTLTTGTAFVMSIDSGSYAYTGSSVNLVYVSFISNLYLGSTNIQTAYIGSTPVSKVYLGSTQVFG